MTVTTPRLPGKVLNEQREHISPERIGGGCCRMTASGLERVSAKPAARFKGINLFSVDRAVSSQKRTPCLHSVSEFLTNVLF